MKTEKETNQSTGNSKQTDAQKAIYPTLRVCISFNFD